MLLRGAREAEQDDWGSCEAFVWLMWMLGLKPSPLRELPVLYPLTHRFCPFSNVNKQELILNQTGECTCHGFRGISVDTILTAEPH